MLLEGSLQALHLEATLQELQRYAFCVELDCLGIELARVFERYPLLPGAVLMERGQFVGMLSRQRLLEYLIRPHGIDFFLKEPLRVLYSYARSDLLLVPSETSIVVAAQQALRRSPELQGEPIVVQSAAQSYHLLDVHTLNIAYWQIRGVETQVRYERTQAQLIQSDKMASLGRLVDGIAHEILDPVSFIWGNLSHVSAYSDSLLQLLSAYEANMVSLPAALMRLRDDLELDYLQQDLPRTIDSIRTGAERLSKLASSLQNFCHIDEVYPKPADLHELLDSILLLLKSRLTSEIRVVKQYGHLPPVMCFAGQLHQVFMNILTHAVDALIDQAVSQQLGHDFKANQSSGKPTPNLIQPTIAITTEIRTAIVNGKTSRWVAICIADNGPGLSIEDQTRIWETFSVKKRAEKETSLAVSYQIMTAKHGGKFEMRSRHTSCESPYRNATGKSGCEPLGTFAFEHCATGTEFELLLPLV
ncbi:MAG: sensor histidine kinase [Lyngbya sp. HA4199-MV5]|jgi:signal transduction histidine kinase|nr:sensor histidine kinase [Lyngbya sp. HA4199-MV5]